MEAAIDFLYSVLPLCWNVCPGLTTDTSGRTSTYMRPCGEKLGICPCGARPGLAPLGFCFPSGHRGEDISDAPHLTTVGITWPSTQGCLVFPFTLSSVDLLTLFYLGVYLGVFKTPVCPCPQVWVCDEGDVKGRVGGRGSYPPLVTSTSGPPGLGLFREGYIGLNVKPGPRMTMRPTSPCSARKVFLSHMLTQPFENAPVVGVWV